MQIVHFKQETLLCFNFRTIQRKQKEIKDLRASLEKLSRDNEKLNKKLEAAWLESSLGATVVKAEVVNEDKEGHGDDRMGHDKDIRRKDENRKEKDEGKRGKNEDKKGKNGGKNEPEVYTEGETTTMNEELETSRNEGN